MVEERRKGLILTGGQKAHSLCGWEKNLVRLRRPETRLCNFLKSLRRTKTAAALQSAVFMRPAGLFRQAPRDTETCHDDVFVVAFSSEGSFRGFSY